MKVFIIGLPKSGRTTVAKAIAKHYAARYIDAMSWVKATFREQKVGEHVEQYEDEYDRFLSVRRMVNPWFISSHVFELLKSHEQEKIFIIDGIGSPKDFSELFDYRQDVVIFLNRTGADGDPHIKDHENIGISVIRDYCFWLSSANLLPRHKWIEYNFKIPGEEADFVKELGSKNSVFIIRSINKVIGHAITCIDKCITYPTV